MERARDDRRTTAGVTAGETVVVDGQDKLQDGSKVDVATRSGGTTGSKALNDASSALAISSPPFIVRASLFSDAAIIRAAVA